MHGIRALVTLFAAFAAAGPTGPPPLRANGPVKANGAPNVDFWISHFNNYRQEHPNLRPDQEDLLRQAEKWMKKPDLETGPALYSAAMEAFGPEEAPDLFSPSAEVDGTSQLAKRYDICHCRMGQSFCRPWQGSCTPVPPGTNCQPPWIGGCGWGNQFQCNGYCQ